jgi:hypothetical protein
MAEDHAGSSQAEGRAHAQGPSAVVVYWRYLVFWLLLFGLLYFISLYGIVAEA